MLALLTPALRSTLREYNLLQAFLTYNAVNVTIPFEVIAQNDTKDLIIFNLLYNIISCYNRVWVVKKVYKHFFALSWI